MEIKNIFIYAFLITLLLFMSIMLLTTMLEQKRETFIDDEMQHFYNSLTEMQTFILMSEMYGGEMACQIYETKLRELDRTVWDLGRKIDQYRQASEEFLEDPYYKQQKKIFNENEIFYLMLMTKLKRECGFDQTIVSFFYQNSADCPKCDDQSFILTDLNRDYTDEISIFSFDLDLNLSSVRLLDKFYNVTEYPCTVINEQAYCGIQSKDFILGQACNASPNLSACQ